MNAPTTLTAVRAAFANIGTWPTIEEAPGQDLDPTELHVGDIVVGWGFNRARLMVVTSVGRKNAKAVFYTPGNLEEAERMAVKAAEAWARREAHLTEAEAAARKNYTWIQAMADGTADLYARFPDQYGPERKADEQAKYQATLDELEADGGVEANVADHRTKTLARLADWKTSSERTLFERCSSTSATIKAGRCKLVTRGSK